ncbi:MAG TPA: response regulator [Sphingomicrobium sp.]
MLFGKRKRVVNRILIVEDEPLLAFDNEVMLGDLGYEVVATLDSFEAAIELLDREKIDLILSD